MTLPLENLDDKSFSDLVRDAVASIPVYAPQWTDHNKSDPGITLIELLAWIVEMQIYRLNRVTDRNRLKFLKLLGLMGLEPARSALVDLSFIMAESPAATNGLVIPANTQVAASDPATGEEIIFETVQDLFISSMRIAAVLTIKNDGSLSDKTESNQSESTNFSVFGDDPANGDALYLGLDSSPKDQELTVAFYLHQKWRISGSGNGSSHSNVVLVWEYYAGGDWRSDTNWKELIKVAEREGNAVDVVRDTTDDLTVSGKAWIRVQGDASHTTIGERDLYWIRIRIAKSGYYAPPVIESILSNVVSAIQRAQITSSFSSPGLPKLQISLGKVPVIRDSLELAINGENSDWTVVSDLDASGPGDRHYTLDPVSGKITFGDGIHGKIPPKGENNITVSFSSGGGIRGNVAKDAINRVLDSELAPKVLVNNQRVAFGGKDAETLEEAIGRARTELRTVNRAVTPDDYEFVALKTPGLSVARAKAIPLYHPSQPGSVPDTVTMIVVPNSYKPMPIPGPDFLKTVYRHVDLHRTMGTEIFVIPPIYLEVIVLATVIRMPTDRKETVETAVLDRLNSFLSPLKGGGSDKNGWPFGRPVYISEIYALLDQVKGVDYIKKLTLVRSSICKPAGNGAISGQDELECIVDGSEVDGDIQMPAYGLACSGKHKVVAYSEDEYSKISNTEV
jgi:predicted phage baseplate assembly protein